MFSTIPAAFQDTAEDPGKTAQPVQTVVDAVLVLTRSATAESRRDLSADDAKVRVAELERFYQGLSHDPRWPSSSVANALPSSPFAFAEVIYHIVASIPGDVETLAQVESFCVHDRARAEFDAFEEATREGRERLASLNSTIYELQRIQPPPLPGVSIAPLRAAANELSAFRASLDQLFQPCLGSHDVLFFRLAPSRIWPGGRVELLGAAAGYLADQVQIRSDSLGYGVTLTVGPDGVFSASHELPVTAAFGAHPFTATVGDISRSRNLTVEKATTRILIDYPGSVRTSSGFTIRATVVGPLTPHMGPGPLMLSRAQNASQVLVNGSASFQLQAADSPTVMRFTLEYPGSAIHLGSRAEFHVDVVPLRVVRDDVRQTALLDLQLSPDVFNRFLLLGPLVFALFIAIQFVDQRYLAQRRRAAALAEQQAANALQRESEAITAPPEFTSGVLAGITNFIDWLTRRGRTKPHQTLREAAPAIQRHGANPWPVIRAFEKIRYGGYEEPSRLKTLVPQWAKRLWERMRGWRR